MMLQGVAVPVEHERAIEKAPTPPAFDQVAQGLGEDEDAAFAGLASLRTQANDAARAVHIAPFETEDFTTPPASEVAEVEHVLVLRRQVTPHRSVLVAPHEPLPRLRLRQPRDIRPSTEAPGLQR